MLDECVLTNEAAPKMDPFFLLATPRLEVLLFKLALDELLKLEPIPPDDLLPIWPPFLNGGAT